MRYVVFLDTNIYDAANYSFHNALFSRLKEYTESGIACLQINSVIEGEVRDHIQKNVVEALKSVNKALKNRSLAAFKKLPVYSERIQSIDETIWVQELLNEFESYLSECKTERITVNNIDVEDILQLYFQQKPPFEAKKPEEFKDAIAIASLFPAMNNIGDDIFCVISDDKGFREAVSNGIMRNNISERKAFLFPSLKDFISFIESGKTHLLEFLKSDLVSDAFSETIRSAIEAIDICVTGIDPWIEEKGIVDVDEIRYEPHIVKIDGENDLAIVSLDVSAEVLLDYTYTDEDKSYYDKEDRCYYWQTIIEMSERYQICFDMVVSVDISHCWRTKSGENDEQLEFEEDTLEIVDVIEAPESVDVDKDDCLSSEVVSDSGSTHDTHGETVRAYGTCPDCGCPIGYENDGGNGFCIHCAPNH